MLIGLTGYKQAGKDSTADVLVKHFGFTKLAFADALREIALAANPFIEVNEHMVYERYDALLDEYGYEECKYFKDFRGFLQRLGTEGIRKSLGPEVWVNAVANKMADDPDRNYVITDCRFPNEANWIKERGQLWRITRVGQINNDLHESEQHIGSFQVDLDIEATTLAELQDKALKAYLGEPRPA